MTIDMVRKYENNLTVGKAIGFYFLSFILLFAVDLLVHLILGMIGLGANAIYFPSQDIVLIATALLVLRKYGYSENDIFCSLTKVNLLFWFLILISTASQIPISLVIASGVERLFPKPEFFVKLEQELEGYYTAKSFLEYFRLMILGGVLASLAEELFFRGFLQTVFCQRLGDIKGIVLASLFFMFSHLMPWGFPDKFLGGLFLGFLYLRTGTLWAPIFAHFLNNSVLFSVLFFFNRNSENLGNYITTSLPLHFVASLIFCVSTYFIFMLTKKSTPKTVIPNIT
jgi:membrane protease YdiL (CAAX protease family)